MPARRRTQICPATWPWREGRGGGEGRRGIVSSQVQDAGEPDASEEEGPDLSCDLALEGGEGRRGGEERRGIVSFEPISVHPFFIPSLPPSLPR